MKIIYSYVVLIAALIIDLTFGFSTIQLPDSFGTRGALPGIEEWSGNRARTTTKRYSKS